ncbi:Peptidase C13, legumain [Salix suchowensis]|nr:Peptidase C13, legumain [Salix suchowensis]
MVPFRGDKINAQNFTSTRKQVRSYDYHHYLCLLELPPNIRKAAFALRAFNVETARAMDVASDPNIGLMRLLWWQEAIDKIYANKVIEHPTAQALSSVISENRISKGWLKRPVEARINDARREVTDIPETIEELEKYAEDTVSTLLYMTLQAGDIKSTAADHAASHVGKASGLLCCLDHFHIMLVATDTFVTYQLKWQPNMGTGSFISWNSPAEARSVLLPAVPAQVFLDTLRQVHFDVFDPRLARGVMGISPLWHQLK